MLRLIARSISVEWRRRRTWASWTARGGRGGRGDGGEVGERAPDGGHGNAAADGQVPRAEPEAETVPVRAGTLMTRAGDDLDSTAASR